MTESLSHSWVVLSFQLWFEVSNSDRRRMIIRRFDVFSWKKDKLSVYWILYARTIQYFIKTAEEKSQQDLQKIQ